jgi:hypothetical protein
MGNLVSMWSQFEGETTTNALSLERVPTKWKLSGVGKAVDIAYSPGKQ